MNQIWVQHKAWQDCVSNYKRGDVLAQVLPKSARNPFGMMEIEIWAREGKQPCRMADAYLYGNADMHLCDIPDWVMEKYYAPHVRSITDLIDKWTGIRKVTLSSRVDVFLFAIKGY